MIKRVGTALLAAVFLTLAGPAAAAGTVSVFVINFTGSEGGDVISRLFERESAASGRSILIDAGEQALIGEIAAGDPPRRRADAVASIVQRFREASAAPAPAAPAPPAASASPGSAVPGAPQPTPAAAGPPRFNLARVLDLVADVVRPHAGAAERVDIYLVNTLFHQDDRFTFADGYPNDGFLFKDDSEFAFIDHVRLANARVHVLATSNTEFAARYQRFFHHLAGSLFSATLATFSVAPTASAMAVGDLPALEITPIDRSVGQSQVLGRDKVPVCPYEDRVAWADQAGRVVEITVTNPCRRNSPVSFTVKAGDRTGPESPRADDQGVVHLRLPLRAGENRVMLTGLDNVSREIFKTQATPDDDQIMQTVADGSVELVGRNPLRRDGDEVTVRHPESGRTWTVRVVDGVWRLKAPVSVGVQRFTVSRPGGTGEPQAVDVNGGRVCEEKAEGRQHNGTGTVRVVSPCRVGQELTFRHLDDSYPRQFNPSGKAELVLSLACGQNTIRYPGYDGRERVVELAFDCTSVIKITLKWQAAVDLDLHVQEKNAEPGDPGWIYFENMNQNGEDGGLGELDIDDTGEQPGLKVENYQLEAARYPAGQRPKFFIDYYSRGSHPQKPYCGDGALANVPFQVIVIDRGRTEKYDMVMDRVPCGGTLSGDPRLRGKPGPDGQLRPAGAPAPVAVDDAVTTLAGVAIEIPVLTNDRAPPGGGRLELVTVGTAGHGSTEAVVGGLGGGSVRYRPAPGFSGTDAFTYEIRSSGGQRAGARVAVTVTPAPAAAVPSPPSLPLAPSSAVASAPVVAPPLPPAPLLPPQPQVPPVSAPVPEPASPLQALPSTESILASLLRPPAPLSPPPGASGVAPRLLPDSAVTAPGRAVEIPVLRNDGVAAGTAVRLGRPPAGGSVEVNAGGVVRYTPRPGFTGRDQFVYEAGAGAGAEVSIWVVRCDPNLGGGEAMGRDADYLFACGRLAVEQGQAITGLWSLEAAARHNHGPALTALGRLYDPHRIVNDPLVPPDRSRAIAYYRRAVAAGEREAQGPLEALGP